MTRYRDKLTGRSRASYRKAALKGWVKRSAIKASRKHIKPGKPVVISWNAYGKSWTIGRRSVPNSGQITLHPRQTTTYTLTARGYGRVSIRRVTVHVEEQNREYLVTVIFKTRLRGGKERERRLPDAILVLANGETDENIKKAYAEWLIANNKEGWTRKDIGILVFEPNAGRKLLVVPRDQPSQEPAGTVKFNDYRKPKRKRRKAK